MTSKPDHCPKCRGTMQIGFVPDTTYGAFAVAGWHPGTPSKSFWQGVKVDKEAVLALEAHRCKNCGFVEFHANEPVTAR